MSYKFSSNDDLLANASAISLATYTQKRAVPAEKTPQNMLHFVVVPPLVNGMI